MRLGSGDLRAACHQRAYPMYLAAASERTEEALPELLTWAEHGGHSSENPATEAG